MECHDCHVPEVIVIIITVGYACIAFRAIASIPWRKGYSVQAAVAVVCFSLVFVACGLSGYATTLLHHFMSPELAMKIRIHIHHALAVVMMLMIITDLPGMLGRATRRDS